MIAKICGFAGALVIIRLLPENDFGLISIVASVFALFLPFSGFGSAQSLLRYGSLQFELTDKKVLSAFLFREGFYKQIILSAAFLSVSLFYLNHYSDVLYLFLFFTIRLIGFYFYNHLQAEARINHDNVRFSKVTNTVNIGGLLSIIILTYFFGFYGYLSAIAFAPFLSLFWFRLNDYLKFKGNKDLLNSTEIRKYGLYSAGTALLSDLLFSADVLLLSILMNAESVANYKVAMLIPANITFLSLTFMQSDFPHLAKNYKDKNYLMNYIRNYYKIFLPLTTIIFLIGFIFNREILLFFFGGRYENNTTVFFVLLLAFCLNMLFRNLYGNLLSAVGRIRVNTIISFFSLILLLYFGWICVPKFGVTGIALSLFLSMLISGLLLSFTFYQYWKDLK